jgi:hypothetical protein
VLRRNFIRVLGGGVIVAAGATSAGCSSVVPPEAILPWQGPTNETDVRRWILSHAILAAHSHNLQSWVVDLGTPDQILLRCDQTRLLPETDPFMRQIMMSHGTFLELLDIAARERGLRADITLFPEGAFGPEKIDDRPVARIQLAADPTIVKDALFAQILQRRTNRSAYDLARAVPSEARQAMADAVALHGMRFGFVGAEQPTALQRHRVIASQAWRIELVTPRTVMESYEVLRIGAAEVAQHRDGLTVMDPKLVWLNRLGLFDRSQAPAPDSFATTSQLEDFDAKMASTASFLWLVSTGNERATQVSAGRAYARVQLAGTAHGIVMQPLSQALQEYPEQAEPYAAIHGLLEAPQPAQTVQMWARVGFAPPVEPAPRRGLDAHIVRA